MFVSPQLVDIPENATIKISLSHQALSQHNIGRFRIAISSVPGELITLNGFQVPVNITKIIETDIQKRSLQQKEELRKYYKATSFKEYKVASDKLVLLKNNLVDNKEMSEKVLTKNVERVRAYRQRKKEELGDEKYREFMRDCSEGSNQTRYKGFLKKC